MPQTGKNQPIAKLVRFMLRLRSTASLNGSWLAGTEYNRILSIPQIRTSETIKATR